MAPRYGYQPHSALEYTAKFMDPFTEDLDRGARKFNGPYVSEKLLVNSQKFEAVDTVTEAYYHLLENSQNWLLGRLAEHIKSQDVFAAEASRVEVIEIDEQGNRTQQQPTTSHAFRALLDHTTTSHTPDDSNHDSAGIKPPSDSDPAPVRRIVIMEDVSRSYMGILGSRLRIPPTFFARHLLEQSVLEDFRIDDSKDDEAQSFTLPFFRFAKAPKVSSNQPLEEMYRVKANATRLFAFPKPHGTFDLRGTIIEVEHCFSFWCRTRADNDWDVVILVDPPLKNEALAVNTSSRLSIGTPRKCSYIAEYPPNRVLPSDTTTWPTLEKSHEPDAFFDLVSNHFHQPDFHTPSDPFMCSLPLRQIALQSWNDFLNHAMHCLILTKGEPYPDNAHFSSAISMLWAPTVEEWLLGRMVKWSRRLHIEATVLSVIMRGFNIAPLSTHSVGGGHDGNDLATRSKVGSKEARMWALIREKTLEYKSLYDDMASSYMQVCSLRESLASNQQARGVRRLSAMGALFVPVSLSATLLSMADPFTPGKDRFWVFFAIAVPFLIVFSAWLFVQPGLADAEGKVAAKMLDTRLVGSVADGVKMPSLGKRTSKEVWTGWRNRFSVDARSMSVGQA
ncbi:uncharacterized protein AB675_8303 [Cyphellophora attinorum]|uniref:Uncharacterized protein n=1 Tax=Cyphellophora attinorum TaxID=1664694 RepID=A0A0N1P182_9EURO|nr:uncharacterized protein AB675_8303 [Phialophora attinorum]KPI44757.1 hypothetical protein AB675_8303 [Phialophora attinorum]